MHNPTKDSWDPNHNIPHFAHPEKLIVNLVWNLSSRSAEAKTFHDSWTMSKRVTLNLHKKSEVKHRSHFLGLLGPLLGCRGFPSLDPMPAPSIFDVYSEFHFYRSQIGKASANNWCLYLITIVKENTDAILKTSADNCGISLSQRGSFTHWGTDNN